ncbi:MAG: DUF2490 domain-containing protein [Saprospiraceae bacterium]|nr:DUF2490 domain-containing protein [Lewinella sp.]
MKNVWLVTLLVGMVGLLYGQHAYTLGLMSGININKKLENGWSLNGKTQARLDLGKGVFSSYSEIGFEYQFMDVAFQLSRKVGLNNALAGGYFLRFQRSGDLTHRFIQQFTIVRKYETFRLAHRLMTDQTLRSGRAMTFRARYRIAADMALSGQTVDPGEFYLKINHEYLGRFQGPDFDLEVRLGPALGYAITDGNKFEWAFDYRLRPLFQSPLQSNFVTTINWYRSF